MKKIAIFQANLKVGGIQRSLYNLLNSGFFNDDYMVDVYLFSDDFFFDVALLPSNINIVVLPSFSFIARFIPFNLLLRYVQKNTEFLNQYDYVIDYDSYRPECAYYTIKAINATRIMWIHNDIVREYKFNKKYRILYFFMKNKYKYYNQFVAVSTGIVDPFVKMTKQCSKRIVVVPNIIDVKSIHRMKEERIDVDVDENKLNIISVGRIYVAKGYDILLKDFERAYILNRKLRLYIVGEGPDEKKIKKWTNRHNLSDVVCFLGKKNNPFSIMNMMDAFCLESRYEGQGMVFMEAKALGLDIIIPKHLEKYNYNITGVNDIALELANVCKKEKKYDDLCEYHQYVYSHLETLFFEKDL